MGHEDGIVTTRTILKTLLSEVVEAAGNTNPRVAALSAAARLIPKFTFARVRAQLFRLAGVQVENSAALMGNLTIVGPRGAAAKLHIGPECMIGPEVTMGLDAPITIGRGVSISPGATLYTGSHNLGAGSQRMSPVVSARPIVVEDGAWIGMRALILPGVRVGKGAVVAAGAVVTQDVPPNTLVSGNPAAVVRKLPLGDR
jgi:acetyltransferase-like isoleucine patch superfamily enzyme